MSPAEFLAMLAKHGIDGRVIGGPDYPSADVSTCDYVIVSTRDLAEQEPW